MSQQKQRFVELLEELFQLNQPELDFGLYRILHARSQEIRAFMNGELATEIDQAFAGQAVQSAHELLQAAKQKVLDDLADDAFDAAGELKPEYRNTKIGKDYLQAQQAAREGGGPLSDQAQVYDHLYRFFSRYYDKGDFMSKRYFVAENDQRAAPYAVPYDGREVMLHWANKDQYYIKSSEHLSNYSFDLTEALRMEAQRQGKGQELDFGGDAGMGPMKVHFRLAAATEGEHNNVKESQDRFFVIHADEPIKFEAGSQGHVELVVQFEYRPDPDKTGQANTWQQQKLAEAAQTVLQALQTAAPNEAKAQAYARGLASLSPTEKRPDRTVLAKYMAQFADRNTMDYFIHKDLGGFLRRELDFYIKNEVMRLDDIESAQAPRVEAYLGKLRVLRKIARRVVDFLEQIENFQKRLWLKKKLVVGTGYCVSVGLVPKSLWPQISHNKAQHGEWSDEGWRTDSGSEGTSSIPYPITHEFLEENKLLVIDTKNFDREFTDALISGIDNLDERLDGVAIHSENFQGLRFVEEKLKNRCRLIYIDPPYNTGGDDFVYKDRYQHSTWASMQMDRLRVAKSLLADDAAIVCNLNDIEDWRWRAIAEEVMEPENYITTVITKCSTASSFRTANLGPVDISDRVIFFAKNKNKYKYAPVYAEKAVDLDHFSRFVVNIDSPCSEWVFKPIKLQVLQDMGFECTTSQEGMKKASERFGASAAMLVIGACQDFAVKNAARVFETKTLQKPSPNLGKAISESKLVDHVVIFDRDGADPIYLLKGRQVYFLEKSIKLIDGKKAVAEPVSTIWQDIDTNNLKHEGGVDFPNGKKPIKLLSRIISMASESTAPFVLDYFAGSGSTGHAVLESNRKAAAKQKFMLIEMGDHFDATLLPRLKNSLYATHWKKGNPVPTTGQVGGFKYIRLESFEDVLNALTPNPQGDILSHPTQIDFRREYILKYWLNHSFESHLNPTPGEHWSNPFQTSALLKNAGTDTASNKPLDLVETFNWLLGLHVTLLDKPRQYAIDLRQEEDPELPGDHSTRWIHSDIDEVDSGEFWFRMVEGHVFTAPGDELSRERVLVIWRKLTGDPGRDQAALEAWLSKMKINPRDTDFAAIYVNGSHALNTDGSAGTRVCMIEETFAQRMWEDC